MNDEDPDLALFVPLKPIYEEFCCPVCFNTLASTYMTPCGHNFCEGCLKECLNRKHVCPCCNKEVEPKSIVKNHHFDRLVGILEKEKEEASKRYFEKLINRGPGGLRASREGVVPNNEQQGLNMQNFSPIEQVFYAQMKKSLVAYSEYYQDLCKKKEKLESDLKSKYMKQVSDIHDQFLKNQGGGKSKEELDATVAQMMAQCEKEIQGIEQSFVETTQLLVAGFEKFLQDNVCPPSFLPVALTLTVPSKQFSLKLVVKPSDCAKDLKTLLQQKMADKGDPIVEFHKENFFLVKGTHGTTMVNDDLRPLLQFNIHPGCEVELQGQLQLKSDLPKVCFRAVPFEKGMSMDYYSCKDCNSNWICKPCAETCHKGHKLTEHLFNHKPTWACCYCFKTKKCCIQNHEKK
jgi:hypothetical protein